MNLAEVVVPRVCCNSSKLSKMVLIMIGAAVLVVVDVVDNFPLDLETGFL